MATPVDAARSLEALHTSAWEMTGREGRLVTRWAAVDSAVVTSRGPFHAVNEDCHSPLDAVSPLFVVADGVGGGACASTASRQLVSHLHTALDADDSGSAAVRAALIDADRAIGRSIASRSQARGAATVAVCRGSGRALAQWVISWVGDCRVYRLHETASATAKLVTTDDSYRTLDEVPPRGGSLDDPARMVGNGAVGVPNVREITLDLGEMLVLCSDGVHKHANANDIARLLSGAAPLLRRCERLIGLARERGSRDDATVLVVRRMARPSRRLARGVVVWVLAALMAGAAAWLAKDSSDTGHAGPAGIELHQQQGAT